MSRKNSTYPDMHKAIDDLMQILVDTEGRRHESTRLLRQIRLQVDKIESKLDRSGKRKRSRITPVAVPHSAELPALG